MSTANPPPPSPAPPPPAAPSPSPWYRRLRWLVLLLLVGGVTAAVIVTQAERRLAESRTDDAFVEAHIVNVAPEAVSGRIVRYFVQENDLVEQEQVIAEIDPTHYRDQVSLARGRLDVAEAEYRRQQAGLTRLRREVPIQVALTQRGLQAARAEQSKADEALKLTRDEVGKTIDEGRAGVVVARANYALAKQERDRFTALYRENAVPERRQQEVQRSHDATRAEMSLADARLGKAVASRTRVEVARRDAEAATAVAEKAKKAVELAETGDDQIKETELLAEVKRQAVEEAKRALTAAENTLAYTKVRAPFPGVVVKRYRHLGDMASAGVPILSMYNPDLLYVTANLEETRLRGVQPGNEVQLRLDAFREPFRGRVVWINKSTGAQFALMPRNVVSGEFTKVVQRVPVRIWIDKDERWPQLRAGLSVSVIIAHGEGDAGWAEQAALQMRELETRYNEGKE